MRASASRHLLCDNWCISNWRLACHMNFDWVLIGECGFELARRHSCAALAWHSARSSAPRQRRRSMQRKRRRPRRHRRISRQSAESRSHTSFSRQSRQRARELRIRIRNAKEKAKRDHAYSAFREPTPARAAAQRRPQLLPDRVDPGRTRTYNPRLHRPMPYPLGHGAICLFSSAP